MITSGAATQGAANPLSYDAIQQNAQKQAVSNQTSGGSMFGMPTEAQNAVKAESSASMPTAKEVAADNKIYGTANDPERKPLWQPPAGKKISQGMINIPKAEPKPLPEAEIGTQTSVAPIKETQSVPENDFSAESFANLDDSDKGDFASAQAMIKEQVDSGTDEDKKETSQYYTSYADELEKKADAKWPLWATIASVALFAFSDGTFPPINFMKLTGTDEAKTKWTEFLANQADYQKTPGSKVEGVQAAGEAKEEAPNKFEEGVKAASEMSAAEQGVQTAKELDWKYLKDKMKVDQTNAKELMKLKDDLDTNSQIKILQAAHGYTMEEKEQAYGFLVDEMKDKLESMGLPATKENLIDYSRALMGESAWTKNAGIVTNILGTAGGVALKAGL